MRATAISFERRYSDDSGVEFGVSLGAAGITFESIHLVSFPVEEIDWLIQCLQRIKAELGGTHEG
ncbi:MAG: hypothetical protein JWR07_1876 [Nevskia sp.]|nr:hypothetical protein [Nevskia sp.]